MVATTSAANPADWGASETTTARPVRSTAATMASMSSGHQRPQVEDLGGDAVLVGQHLRRLAGHLAPGRSRR